MDSRIATIRNTLEGQARELPEPDTARQRLLQEAQRLQEDPQFDSLYRRPLMMSRPVVMHSVLAEFETPLEAAVVESHPPLFIHWAPAPAYDAQKSSPLIDAIVMHDFGLASQLVDGLTGGLNKFGVDKNTAQHYLYSIVPDSPANSPMQKAIFELAMKLQARAVKQLPNAYGMRPIDYAKAFNPELHRFMTEAGSSPYPFKD